MRAILNTILQRPALRSNGGFSLIETLVSLALIALTVAAVGNFLDFQYRTTTANHLASQAYSIAAEELETVRSLPFDAMTNHARDLTQGSVAFSVATTVEDNQPAQHMKRVNVVVSWSQPGGAESVSLQTIYTDPATG